MEPPIRSFEATWEFVRQMTYDFVEAVPSDQWERSPHARYAPFHKQVRHLVCVQGVYIHGLRDRAADFGKKHTHYAGPLDRRSLADALRAKDEALAATLRTIEAEDDEDRVIEFYGPKTLGRYLDVFIQHESLHHGTWSVLAALGGFETPESWRVNWGL